jgi:excisionase family DNA binding protein
MLESQERRSVETMPAEQVWFRPEEAATHIRVGRTTMYKLLRAGKIPSVTEGRVRLIRRSDLDSYLEGKYERAES